MRRWYLAALALAAVVCWAGGDINNLIPNPTFAGRAGENGVPPQWEPFDKGTTTVRFGVSAGEHGGKLLEIANPGGNNGARMVPFAPLADDITYIAGGWVRNIGEEARGTLQLEYGKPGRTWVMNNVEADRADDGQWHEFRVVQERGHSAKADGATHVAFAVNAWGQGKCQFDSVWLTTVPKLPGFDTSLLRNGNFEDGRDKPRQTDLYLPKGGKGQWEATAAAAHDGLRGVHIHDVVKEATVATGWVDREHTHNYTLTGWARCRKGEARVRLIYVYDKEWTGWVESGPLPTTGEWTKVAVQFDDSDKAPLCHDMMAAGYVKEGGDADFDSFVLEGQHKPE